MTKVTLQMDLTQTGLRHDNIRYKTSFYLHILIFTEIFALVEGHEGGTDQILIPNGKRKKCIGILVSTFLKILNYEVYC